MPIHDWTRVDAGTFHAFHGAWTTHLMGALNNGLLPEGYYALAEQHAGARVADVLTLHQNEVGARAPIERPPGTLLIEEAPPRVRTRKALGPSATYRLLRRSLAIRHVSGHRIVALVEVVSPVNKDRAKTVEQFLDKLDEAVRLGVHVLMVDLFPPGPHDPRGLHAALWERYEPWPDDPPDEGGRTVAAYLAGPTPEAFVDRVAVGDALPDMPIFLDHEAYVPAPLERTYSAALDDLPRFWRDLLGRPG